MKKLAYLAAFAIAATAATNASAALLATCSVNDIAPTAQACVGFKSGNLISNNQSDVDAQTAALKQLGFDWTGTTVAKVTGLNSATTVNFGTALKGVTYIAVHYGNGAGGPGNGTAFYRLDAGSNLSSITLGYKSASSNAVLYATNVGAAVPEPATWAMMVLGFGLAGYAMRRGARREMAAVRAS
ncbi:MAG: PEPxxWA-CTERM sorting domain-containing protein [Sphingomonas phyllosphaerae]